ncbi:MAG: DUF1801 domain-containing protein [Candidatus Saccharimonadales bacterium]
MDTSGSMYENVDDYIASFSVQVQSVLNQIRAIIKKAAPDAIESIAYGMPAYKQNGKPLVYFAAFKNHIGFYATPQTHEDFSSELGKYKQGKGSVQFPLDQPIPYELISRMTTYKVEILRSGTAKP